MASSSEPAPKFDFKSELISVLPHLRAFARSLTGQRDAADDLVQDALTKAWASRDRFEPGTSMKAWTFMILRNSYISQMRRRRFTSDWDEERAARVLVISASQDGNLELGDLHRALQILPEQQREALILVGAGGLSYEEVAQICGVAIGTVKSRVARARAALASLIESGNICSRMGHDDTADTETADAILNEVEVIESRYSGNRASSR
ncbi:sigma-70 family RNA polymerase sigma factor [Pedomonas sp. V897]|uniref:sigma-70 family RNA polymerase sigma factor n=1 Tax=Pedomonas sp. V897 TaxID=3446482 RepID=UPI003EDEA00B